MEFVVHEPESDESIYVQQIGHGKFARSSSTSLLLSVGALGPALRAGSPVTGSVTSLTRCSRLRWGVKQFARSQYSHPADPQHECQADGEAEQEERLAP